MNDWSVLWSSKYAHVYIKMSMVSGGQAEALDIGS